MSRRPVQSIQGLGDPAIQAGGGINVLRKGPCQMPYANEEYGMQRANSRTHKHYLREHHLGKFKKNKQAK